MSFVMPLSPYNQDKGGFFKMQGQSPVGSNPGSPANQGADVKMSESEVAENAANLGLKSN
mgnify:CR=1 FL=1